MQDQIEEGKVGNNALNEAIDELLVENCDLNDANTIISNGNEILQKEIEDLKVKDENKSKAEARRMEKEQKDAKEATKALKDKGKGVVQQQPDVEANVADVEANVAEVEANEENSLVVAQFFILVGDLKTVYHIREDNARRIEVERRRLKVKEAKKAKADEIGGNGGALIVRPPGADQVDDYFNDEQNEEKEDV
ncbi:hypothetical protein Hanom_Chr06g00531821 [Helianthus anomalus]